MNTEELVRMANQIADYYKAYPEAEALDGVAAHIRSFWDPRMRAGLLGYAAGGGEGLAPLVLAAVAQLHEAA
ncbi:MAG: formate dehydrogenase subunit delta [Kiloniellaceae bacterium]